MKRSILPLSLTGLLALSMVVQPFALSAQDTVPNADQNRLDTSKDQITFFAEEDGNTWVVYATWQYFAGSKWIDRTAEEPRIIVRVVAKAGGLSMKARAEKIAERMNKCLSAQRNWYDNTKAELLDARKPKDNARVALTTPMAELETIITADTNSLKYFKVQFNKTSTLAVAEYYKQEIKLQLDLRPTQRGSMPEAPPSAQLLKRLGDTYVTTGDLDLALIEYHKALKLEPTFFGVHMELAKVYIQLGDKQLARKRLSLAEELINKDQEFKADLAAIAADLNKL